MDLGAGFLECTNSGAFRWGASALEDSSKVTEAGTCLTKNISCTWKLHGDIQIWCGFIFASLLMQNVSHGWMKTMSLKLMRKLCNFIILWKRACSSAALSARHSYQQALCLAPWQANIYTDIAITIDVVNSLKEDEKHDPTMWLLPEKMILGGLLLESCNNEFCVALGCLSHDVALKQHAFVRSLQLDVSLAVAWAYLGKLYRRQGQKKLAQHAFDGARNIDPALAFPWAGMSADISIWELKPDEAYDCCLHAMQILPLPEFQMGLAKLAKVSGQV